MRMFSPHCPNCGARVALPEGQRHATCEYCGGTLILDHWTVTHVSKPAAPRVESKEPERYPQPDATLVRVDSERFELSMLEQRIDGAPPEKFVHLELSDARFALIYLRAVDGDRKGVKADLETAFTTLKTSLDEDGDPGLAANLALEALTAKGFNAKLECSVMLFDPKRMTLTAYDAGCRDSLWWVSQEEGRTMTAFQSHDPLEKKMLREARDHFSNSRPIRFAAGDLFVLVSAGYAGRGGGSYADGTRALVDALNGNLGEEPLRVVTLAKNAYWDARGPHDRPVAPPGDIRVAAVRALLPELRDSIGAKTTIEVLRSRKYSVAIARQPGDAAELVTLFDDRQVAIWIAPVSGKLPETAMKIAREAILGVLDRKDHGDNDNPREAGRRAYQALGVDPAKLRMAVIQLLDVHGRVKYFRAGWKQPLSLGPRGLRDTEGMQAFDEGGEATVSPGSRLFFPGTLPYDGEPNRAEEFAERWRGGKASLLYEAMRDHWKTKKPQRALEKLIKAALSDAGTDDLSGIALVSGEEV